MGYIQELEQELQTRLADLGEREQKEVIRFVKEKILESYRNGILSAELTAADKEAERATRRLQNNRTHGH